MSRKDILPEKKTSITIGCNSIENNLSALQAGLFYSTALFCPIGQWFNRWWDRNEYGATFSQEGHTSSMSRITQPQKPAIRSNIAVHKDHCCVCGFLSWWYSLWGNFATNSVFTASYFSQHPNELLHAEKGINRLCCTCHSVGKRRRSAAMLQLLRHAAVYMTDYCTADHVGTSHRSPFRR